MMIEEFITRVLSVMFATEHPLLVSDTNVNSVMTLIFVLSALSRIITTIIIFLPLEDLSNKYK